MKYERYVYRCNCMWCIWYREFYSYVLMCRSSMGPICFALYFHKLICQLWLWLIPRWLSSIWYLIVFSSLGTIMVMIDYDRTVFDLRSNSYVTFGEHNCFSWDHSFCGILFNIWMNSLILLFPRTHWGWAKMAAFEQTTFSDTFYKESLLIF